MIEYTNMKKEVLVIEDDLFILDTIALKLKNSGFTIASAKNADEAEAALSKNKPDIVLLDIILPQVNGLEILKRIKSDPIKKSIPVIIFSNLGSDKDKKDAMDLGAAEYMVKADFTPSQVVEKVKQMLSQ